MPLPFGRNMRGWKKLNRVRAIDTEKLLPDCSFQKPKAHSCTERSWTESGIWGCDWGRGSLLHTRKTNATRSVKGGTGKRADVTEAQRLGLCALITAERKYLPQRDSYAPKTKHGIAWERPWDLKEPSRQEWGHPRATCIIGMLERRSRQTPTWVGNLKIKWAFKTTITTWCSRGLQIQIQMQVNGGSQ